MARLFRRHVLFHTISDVLKIEIYFSNIVKPTIKFLSMASLLDNHSRMDSGPGYSFKDPRSSAAGNRQHSFNP